MKILLGLDRKLNMPVVVGVFETNYFWRDFSKTHVHIVILEIKSPLPNLTSNCQL